MNPKAEFVPGSAGTVSGREVPSSIPEPWLECGALLADLLVTGSSHARPDKWAALAAEAPASGCELAGRMAETIARDLRRHREGSDFQAAAVLDYREDDPSGHTPTISLSVDYIGPAPSGSWLVAVCAGDRYRHVVAAWFCTTADTAAA